jgi:hypothetical protein
MLHSFTIDLPAPFSAMMSREMPAALQGLRCDEA